MVVWLNSLKTTIAEVKDHPQGESIGKQDACPTCRTCFQLVIKPSGLNLFFLLRIYPKRVET